MQRCNVDIGCPFLGFQILVGEVVCCYLILEKSSHLSLFVHHVLITSHTLRTIMSMLCTMLGLIPNV